MMLENAIYSVIAPESCASILWKDNKFKAEAATALKLTARDMASLNVIDKIISEPAGGAHQDWQTTMELVAKAVADAINELKEIPVEDLVPERAKKFISMTRDVEIFQPGHISEEKSV
jgi:acetyl-CoA carboxylase carboxyl transferase subunit alpha